MKIPGVLLSLVALLISISAATVAHAAPPAATLTVGVDKTACPAAEYSTIQSAVTAAGSGDTIDVCPGTYPEQVIIDKKLTLHGENGAIVMPGPVASNATDLITGEAIAAVILVQNATGVTVDNLIVDGSNNGLAECSPILMGIVYQDASGTIRNNAVRYFTTPTVAGCQSGNGIWIQSSSTGSAKVTVETNSVHDYQKNGITANESGCDVTVTGNVVTEPAPPTFAGPNGIQLGFGATGTITSNTVSGNVFGPCTTVADCTAASTGILLYESNAITIENNSVGTDQFGIYAYGNNSSIENNTVFNSLVFDGIVLMGNGNQATGNTVTHSDSDGIEVQGNNNEVKSNTITDAAVGILKVSGSTGTTLGGNTYHAVVTTVEDPAPAKTSAPVPAR